MCGRKYKWLPKEKRILNTCKNSARYEEIQQLQTVWQWLMSTPCQQATSHTEVPCYIHFLNENTHTHTHRKIR